MTISAVGPASPRGNGTTTGYDAASHSRWHGYDGTDRLIEHNGAAANPYERRFVFAPGPSTGSGQADEPLVW